jgi:hypothetical protein
MAEGIEIRGGAGEFEAAVIAVVLDRIEQEERAARLGRARDTTSLPAWVRAGFAEEPSRPLTSRAHDSPDRAGPCAPF